MFLKRPHNSCLIIIPGVRMPQLLYRPKTLLCECLLNAEHFLPLHSHPCEKTGYMIPGEFRFFIDSGWIDAEPGDSRYIPQGIQHQVEVMEDSHFVELFSPARPDYIPDETMNRH